MKTAVVLFFIYISGFQSDVYYITFVKGQVQLESSNKTVKVGDKITVNDKLIFKDQNSKVSCISPSRGRFDITPGTSNQKVKGEWLALIKSNLIPSSSQQRLSSRSLGSDSGYDPLIYFANQNDKPIVLLNGIPLPIASSYKMDAQNFFFVQYEFQGKNIVRKVANQNHSLVFNSELFTDNESRPVNLELLKRVNLCYQSMENSVPHSKVLVTFSPVLVDKNELGKELDVLYSSLKALKKNNVTEIKNEILAHLADNYGVVNADEMEKQFLNSLK
jgi:hypothetical protein